jgi:hypothetical protein
VDDGVHTAMPVIYLVQGLHGLSHVGEIGTDEGARVVGRPDQVGRPVHPATVRTRPSAQPS